MKQLFFLSLFLWHLTVVSQEITRVEYFINTDPGFGLATSVQFNSYENIEFLANIENLPDGINILYVRVQDDNGHWSHSLSRAFFKHIAQVNLPAIVKAEYFINIDPGFGQGIKVTDFENGNLSFVADLSGLDDGFHILYLRTFDSNGQWSQTQSRSFLKSNIPSDEKPQIVYLEYFIDVVGEHGEGTPVEIIDPSSELTINFLIDLTNMPLGKHTLHLRARDSNGSWSKIQNVEFTACPHIQTDIEISICEGGNYVFGTKTLTEPGVYTEVFSSASGCDSTVVLTLTVNPVYNETRSANICPGESYTLGMQTLTEPGVYTEVFSSVSGCDSTVILTLNITEVDVTVSVNSPVITANASGAVYQWLDCNNSHALIAGATGQSFTTSENGSYAVEVMQDGCSGISDCVQITNVSVETISIQESFNIYLNFGKGDFTLLLAKPMNVIIYNSLGSIVFIKNFESGNNMISLPGIPEGVYLIKAHSDRETLSGKLIISR